MSNAYAKKYAAPSAAAHVAAVKLPAAVADNAPFVPTVMPSQTITAAQYAVLEEELVSQFECGEITAMQFMQQSNALEQLKLQNVFA